MQGSVSITAGSCSAARVPSVTRALGCLVAPDGGQVSLLLSGTRSAALLRDVRETGMLSVVFSEITTHRTMQVKGRKALVAGPDAADIKCAQIHQQGFGREIARLGFPQGFIDNLLDCSPTDLVKVEFVPCAAFTQTPGPNAGAASRRAP